MRKLVSILRRMMIGPSLDKLSRLSEAELSNLVNVASEDPVMGLIKNGLMGGAGASQAAVPSASDPEALKMLQELRSEQAKLAEKVEVIERVLAKAR